MKKILLIITLTLNLFALDAFIKPSELKDSLKNENTLVLDVSPYALYMRGHIEGATHVDILKFINPESPYKLMNAPALIQDELTSLGINKGSQVVLYSHNGAVNTLYCSYLAFILISHGFENVSILDGGYMAWVFENELLTSTEKPSRSDGNFIVEKQPAFFATLEYIQANSSKIKLLDSRSAHEYYGVARSGNIKEIGHIPHAKSSFYQDKFLTDFTIQSDDVLEAIFINGHELKKEDEIVIYGENAMSASMNWFILYKKMGFKNAKLYEASLLEWGNIEALPMVKYKWETR
ncbi:MAG: sulfurtransferase [Epsilonproteobacteria bacterium]|nr:sulfurtransferase [Campylobacterota bacterium]OIO15183.1 MAG: thiosulfate sulfurtransferase [Helicobacteraceae bacterium CG1_02_36_14]PIP11248.1 MAG: thiosulfate sulfurtransferase [Sulfurimonas sp. CG23_combo_of_CG06-09_8_20_14_all_36_33]PIS23892.1 MAG: thiosulfate sulfurtransferase [Sulfurimonas sp. CG08_land_8_20_14_0_20_36_33]PIU35262.1 MAG: thiosulfate sulfurtransferase [Sulfurimonas sp. CG07_land_8_20_14_0_80_36_56]PIV03925.1 MAG: thiosulfate sulfurtransferase [Sulfurimonas sp. CG03_la